MKKLHLGLVALATAALTVAVPGAFARSDVAAAPQATPGVTSRAITIGTTLPLSGPASLYARIGTGMRAYFSYINARRAKAGHRGVYGRQINLKVYDDQYSEALTVQQTRRLVEQDRVFALLGGLGTENQQAARVYLTQRKVPQLYVSTGLSEFGRLHKQYPWTIGWQPDYTQEGRLHGRYVAQNLANSRVAVLHQNDDYGREYLAGFRATAGANRVAAVETYPRGGGAAAVRPLVPRLRASGADTLLIIATPGESITALAVAYGIGWRPNKLVNSVGATETFMRTAQAAVGGAADAVNGVVTTSYLKDPASTKYANDPQVRRYRQIMAKYAPGQDPNDGLFFYGMAKADTFVQALYRAGRNPTRASLMQAARNLKLNSPWLLRPSAKKSGRIVTSPNSAFPIRYQRLSRYQNGSFVEFGPLVKTR